MVREDDWPEDDDEDDGWPTDEEASVTAVCCTLDRSHTDCMRRLDKALEHGAAAEYLNNSNLHRL